MKFEFSEIQFKVENIKDSHFYSGATSTFVRGGEIKFRMAWVGGCGGLGPLRKNKKTATISGFEEKKHNFLIVKGLGLCSIMYTKFFQYP